MLDAHSAHGGHREGGSTAIVITYGIVSKILGNSGTAAANDQEGRYGSGGGAPNNLITEWP